MLPLQGVQVVGALGSSQPKVVLASPGAVLPHAYPTLLTGAVNVQPPRPAAPLAGRGLGQPGIVHSSSVADSAAVVMLNNLAKLKGVPDAASTTSPSLSQPLGPGGVKRVGVTPSCLQLIPPKMARLDNSSGLSGLGQSGSASGDSKITSLQLGMGVPQLTGEGDVGASSTLQSLAAAHFTTTNPASVVSDLNPLNPVHLMQQMNLPLRPEQPVGVQLSAPNSLPINLNNGEVKVSQGQYAEVGVKLDCL
jgi:hypothetical protein